MNAEIRCPNDILFGKIEEDGVLEVKCRSSRCGARAGVVVLHRFNVYNGHLLGTRVYKNPPTHRKGEG